MPLAVTFAALKAGGYDGWLTIEAFGRALPALAAATRVWRDFFPEREEVYRYGYRGDPGRLGRRLRQGADASMKTIKGPAMFLAQFAGDAAPFNSLDAICEWAASLGYEGVQIPSWDGRLFDLNKAAESKTYCDEVKGTVERHGLAITELSTHLQGQLVAVHPAYDEGFDAFAAPEVRGNPKARQEWAVQQVLAAAKASRHLGLDAMSPSPARWPSRISTPGRRGRRA